MAIDAKQIKDLLVDYNQVDVEKYTSYLRKVEYEKKKDSNGKYTQEQKNPWINRKTSEELAEFFKRVDEAGLKFDGDHVTLQKRGITLDYVAYKNKMLSVYPNTKIAIGVVYKGDNFSYEEQSGVVSYTHIPANPFSKKDDDIIGTFCLIKNERGQFMTTLDKDEIQKHRAVATTDSIWRKWYSEMVQKTVIKKACKFHFDDLFSAVDAIDNEAINLDLPPTGNIELKAKLEALTTEAEVNALYKEENPNGEDIIYFTNRIAEIKEGKDNGNT